MREAVLRQEAAREAARTRIFKGGVELDRLRPPHVGRLLEKRRVLKNNKKSKQ